MAGEQDAHRGSFQPINKQKLSGQPEFGKPTALNSIHDQPQGPFNIPKMNQGRPEHHRPAVSRLQSQVNPKESFDPLKPAKPSEYPLGGNDVVHISRPANLTGATKPAPMALYSSKPATTKISGASNNIKTFIDLTASDPGFATNAHHYHTDISSFDSFSYVDAAKAQENIKALLEGAFEDEDDKPRTRSRKKRIEENVNKIASQLQRVTINGPKEAGKEDHGEEAAEDGYDGEDEEDDGTVEGLKVKLLPHQIEGVSWMHDKETGKKRTRGVLPKGGILADDMGLGKTVQAIALILTNRPSEESGDKEKGKHKEKRKDSSGPDKGTLVVAPLALIKQWESEIETKVEDSHHLRVCVYHGAGRSKLADDLKKYDVVITTYGTLSSEHAAPSKEAGCFSIYWHRVILDEAHTIKNRNAKATQAACALNAEFRWCLTGTPLQNNLDELQSLIAFLRIRPYNDLAAWREQITRPMNNGRGGLAVRRLQVYLKAFMKRRTKDVLKLSENFKPGEAGDKDRGDKTSTGFQITEREVIKVEAEFTPAELAFYQRLEQRTDSRLEQMMGGSHVNYASALVLLLRLRQACNHPDLVGSDLPEDRDVLLGNNTMGSQKQNDINQVADLFGGLSMMSKNCDICQVELTPTEAKSGKSRCHECESSLDVDAIKRQQKKHKKKKRSKKVDSSRSVHRDEKSRKARSQRNRRIIEDSDDDEDGEDGDWVVPKNQRPARNLSKAGGSEDENAEGGGEWLDSGDSETDEDGSLSQKNEVISLSSSFNDKSVNAPDDGEIQTGSDTNEEAGSDTDEDDLSDYEDDENDVLASTKIRYLMKILRRESRDYKFIVFSFFTTMLDKIEPFLKGENLGFARYDGSMRNDSREASLDRLRNHRKTRILLCSLRAGSLGLNLTAASRVVILEPFWNPFVEEQAIDRVHRLNQTIDVKIYKITIKDTVEERILELQERKRQLANATLEGKSKAAKLTMHDMMALFGRDAEARFAADDLDLNRRTKLLSSAESGGDVGAGVSSSLPSSQSSSHDQNRRANQQDRIKGTAPRANDLVYDRRW